MNAIVMALKIIFMGSDGFAVPAVEALHSSSHGLLACVTQPDRPQGRGRHIQACPVKQRAEALGVPVLTPEKIGDAFDALATLRPELIVVAAYGQYIPHRIIELPRLGSINIHPSLLPKYRGAAPIQWAIAAGETETGVTILEVSPRMDAGAIFLQRMHPIDPADTALSLEPQLAALGAELMLDVVDLLERGVALRCPQDETAVTWARKLEKKDAQLDWKRTACELHNRVRGFQPWPGAFCLTCGGRLGIFRTAVETRNAEPGTLLELSGPGPLVACASGALRLLEVQPEGKRAMSGADYLRGCRLELGSVLG